MRPVIALDDETTGLNAWADDIYMVGLYDGTDYVCCRDPITLRLYLRGKYKDYDIVGHRLVFDLKFNLVQKWIDYSDINNRMIHCTQIMGSLVKNRVPKEFLDNYEIMRKEQNKSLPKGQSHREGSPLSLKVMAPWYLKVPPFWETPGDHDNEEYNQKDCMYTYRLFQLLAPRLQAEGSWDFYEKRMLTWSRMVMNMEIKGISLDLEELDLVQKEYDVKRTNLHIKLNNMWSEAHSKFAELEREKLIEKYVVMQEAQLSKGRDPEKTKIKYENLIEKALSKRSHGDDMINYASSQQMSWLLKSYLGLDITDFEGEDSTGKAVLNRLAVEGREDIKTFLDWREADKVLTMYVPTYRSLHVDGAIHPSFNLTGTRTGRISSSGPNLQQVPSKLYRLFRPRAGRSFIQYDLSGIEAALIALYSGDKKLYEILDKGESIHDNNAIAMFDLKCSVDQVSVLYPKQRKIVKNIGFACFYGAGWRRIHQVFAAGGFPITEEEAKQKLKLLKSYYPGAFAFHREITEVFESGQTVRNLFGRPISLQAHENCYMQGFNTLIQSSASDLNLYACEKYWKAGGNPLLLVHDFILGEEKAEYADEMSKVLQTAMTDFDLQSEHGPIKIRVEGEVADGWIA